MLEEVEHFNEIVKKHFNKELVISIKGRKKM